QVDKKRLGLFYIVKKAFLRNQVLNKINNKEFYTRRIFNIPLFSFKKIFHHFFVFMIHPRWNHKRYSLVRLAGQAGEIYGYWSGYYSKSNIFLKVK
ncbi:MAG: hypothetical protein PF503_03835, partial [Desulfobacula sp.]|nr:hypothetical protein [Desulfobacula sp.]